MTVQAKSYPLPLAAPALGVLVSCSHGDGCPLGVDVPALTAAIVAGDRERAARVARASNPFPSSCGHGCHAPCESACRRRYLGPPVAIAALEGDALGATPPAFTVADGPCTSAHDARSVAGLVGRAPLDALRAPRSGRRVAVIGAGACGLACAHDLVLLGHHCVVFEAAGEPGGLLTQALPALRFPIAAARAEAAAILAMGVEFHGGYTITGSADLRALLAAEFDAVFLAIGASTPRESAFAGQPDHPRVLDAMRVLRGVPGDDELFGERTVVVGGGDLAVDAARVVMRRGARDGLAAPRVDLVLDRTIDETDAAPAHITAALTEGIVIHDGWTAAQYLVDATHALAGVEVVRQSEQAARVLSCDTIVTAQPRAAAVRPFHPDLTADAYGRVVVDPDTLRTSMVGVWAGGACAFGHRSIAHALADGKRAAWQIHAALTGHPVQVAVHAVWVEADDWSDTRTATALATSRIDTTAHPVPVADPFSAQTTRPAPELEREASRCYDCTVLPVVDESCTSCGKCVAVCPVNAFHMSPGPPKQLGLDADACTRCGRCVSACPEGAIALLRAVWEERLVSDVPTRPVPDAARAPAGITTLDQVTPTAAP